MLLHSGKVGIDRNAANKESGPRPSDYLSFTIAWRFEELRSLNSFLSIHLSLIEIFSVCAFCFRSIPRERNFCEVRLREMK